MKLTYERLCEVLRYDPQTGWFAWKARKRLRRKRAGERAGFPQSFDGQWSIIIDGRRYPAARLAWFYVHARWPAPCVGHINGDPGDNRLANLREATHAQKMQNRKRHQNNTSGIPGVIWHRKARKWQAVVRHQGRLKYLGLFETAELAASAAQVARRELFGAFNRNAD